MSTVEKHLNEFKWKKGKQHSSSTRPKGTLWVTDRETKKFSDQLHDAFAKIEDEDGMSVIEYSIRKAYEHAEDGKPTLLIAILNKILPDLKSIKEDVSGKLDLGFMSDDELRKRTEGFGTQGFRGTVLPTKRTKFKKSKK